MNKSLQQIIGYVVGGIIVWVIIPFAIASFAHFFDPIFNAEVTISAEVIQREPLRIALVCLFFLVGSIFGIWSIIIQNIIGKGGPVQIGKIDISPKTQNLVVSGPYKYTRNPMLFGACMMYFAFAIYLNSIAAVLCVLFFLSFMLVFVKLSEEKRLLRDFGKSYEAYRQKVSMFIPWIPKK